MEFTHVSELVERLGSDEDAVRKMAVFKLQSNIGDPSFAEVFICEGGLIKLRYLTLHATGNTLAYSLTSFSRLLEVDKGWEYVDQELVERVVELVVTHPLVNILRGAMSILVSIISHPHVASSKTGQSNAFGFRALKPAISNHPQFLEMLVSRLSSADHALCANALQLINSLIREAITNDVEADWPRFIRRLQDLGVIKAVYTLMQSSALQDLAHPLLEFQALSKALLRKWKEVMVDLGKPEHRRALKSLHLASNPEKVPDPPDAADDDPKRRHSPEKWRRLGFESETPAWEFQEVGYLGMMDLTDYVKKHEDGFQKLLLEQSSKPLEQRCPIARASLALTEILYEHFEVEKSDLDDTKNYLALESRSGIEKVFKPLILQWSRLHVCGLQAFFRLWTRTGAELDDFAKVVELVRILIEAVVGSATRTKDVNEVDKEIEEFEYQRLRRLQMELLELTYEDTWGHHLRQVRDELSHEALQFVKEQRIRCLLQGAWFPNGLGYKAEGGPVTKQDLKRSVPSSYRYVRLSHNRRYLHYADFDSLGDHEPPLEALLEKIDLFKVSSVASNVSSARTGSNSGSNSDSDSDSDSSTSTLKNLTQKPMSSSTSTKITIHGYATTPPSSSRNSDPSHHRARSNSTKSLKIRNTKPTTTNTATTNTTTANNTTTNTTTTTTTTTTKNTTTTTTANSNSSTTNDNKEIVLLILYPQSHSLASEWLDGLLMLLNQQPITAETNKLIDLVSNYGLKIRLLNVRFGDAALLAGEEPEIPSREGLDEDYYYDVFGGS